MEQQANEPLFPSMVGCKAENLSKYYPFLQLIKTTKNGDFYPQLDYADQSHFIREVKKFAGVKPIILNKNENDRFIQFSLMPEK